MKDNNQNLFIPLLLEVRKRKDLLKWKMKLLWGPLCRQHKCIVISLSICMSHLFNISCQERSNKLNVALIPSQLLYNISISFSFVKYSPEGKRDGYGKGVDFFLPLKMI